MKRAVYFLLAVGLVVSVIASSREKTRGKEGKGVGSTVLTGSDLSIEKAAQISPMIFVGKIVDAGIQDADAPGESSATDRIQISRWLRGAKGTDEVSFRINVRTNKGGKPELLPERGGTYVFFVDEPKDGTPTVNKILEATADNIKAVSKFVGEPTTKKS